MTIRLSAMFEEHMRKIIYNWKSARRRTNTASSRKKRRNQTPNNKMVTRYNGTRPPNTYKNQDEDDSDEDDSDVPLRPSTSSALKRFLPAVNGHASTSQGPSRAAAATKAAGASSDSSNSDSATPSSEGDSDVVLHVSTLGTRSFRKKTNYDSEDSYKPNAKRKTPTKKKKPSAAAAAKSKTTDSSDNSDSEPLVKFQVKNSKNDSSSDEEDEEDNDSDDQPLISHKLEQNASSVNGAKVRSSSQEDESSQSSSRLTRTPAKNYREPIEDSDDDDDDIPIKVYRGKRKASSDAEYSGETSKRNSGAKRSRKKFSESDLSAGEDSRRLRNAKGKKPRPRYTDSDFSEEEETHRSRRTQQKRPHYNEDSEEDGSTSGIGIGTRQANKFRGGNSEENDFSARTGAIVISSRGRVCRMTERARAAFFRE